MTSPATQTACPCGTGRTFDDCCNRFISARQSPATAEELMRSRYSAFTVQDEGYIQATWHPLHRPQDTSFVPGQAWTGLRILNTTGGGLLDQTGTVHFAASYTRNGQKGELSENSRFERLGGKWVYTDDAGD